ncbi:hypothetical protein TIFTF001_040378 [Ficus carica]|uniref:Uncharacterized protein n=1 Tax=Ficus carica TaxID=3494 RepID=A0AA87YU26_FICCA|nr:hypothetical protein TIFTF001_040378 [Ficus carica]
MGDVLLPPQDGSMTLMREFYANAKEHRNHKTKVRGIVVRFDEETINRHLGLVAPEEDDLANYTKQADIERVLAHFAIAKGMRMNVEAIINAAILHAVNIDNVALPFPSLLTALFEKPEEGEDEVGPSKVSAKRKSKASTSAFMRCISIMTSDLMIFKLNLLMIVNGI